MGDLLFWMILLPLIGSVVNGLILRPASPRRAGVIGTAFAAGSFVIALILFLRYCATGDPILFSLPWVDAGSLHLRWGFAVDALTAGMALIVTGIGSIIHLYSIGYMSDDRTPSRYFAYMNLFLFSMLTLISSDNIVCLFVGWEGVGVCSYLLIGYWYQDKEKANAGIKAFIVNRIGDSGFLLGIFLCFRVFGTLNFAQMASFLSRPDSLGIPTVNLITLLLFIGAMGKSAQIPLYVWLPDAMAGPTPVSALIHAATMVTAGIYMILRMHFLFQLATDTNLFIAWIGGLTSLLAALIATSQNDIKKVLAYSTVSQLGLMVLGLGTGAYFAAFFHLMTHAFFKALLFLGAGSVIHGLSGEQDILKMGGLRKAMPWTFWTFTIATFAISGIPPLSGFFSKDLLLYDALNSPHDGVIFWALGSVASALTAFYMARLYALVFFGKNRAPAQTHPEPASDRHGSHPPQHGHSHLAHESPGVMLTPLVLLAMGSAVAGFIGMPHGFHLFPNWLSHFLEPVIGAPVEPRIEPALSEWTAMGVATLVAVVMVGVGLWFYVEPSRAAAPGRALAPLKKLCARKFYVDELYATLFVRPFDLGCVFLARVVDPRVIDSLALLPSRIARAGGTCLTFVQSGSAQFYLLVMLLGGLAVFWICLKEIVSLG